MPYDYSDTPPPRDFELIPAGTIATVVMHLRAGNVGEDGLFKRSKDGNCEMLDIEFVVTDGPYKGRKFWEYWVLEGTTSGHTQAIEISRSRLKAVLDSALGLQPSDNSPQARAARTVSLRQFDRMTFIAKVGVEKGRSKNDGSGENWPDKNTLAAIITPDKRDWQRVEQAPPSNGGSRGGGASQTVAPPIARPGWAS